MATELKHVHGLRELQQAMDDLPKQIRRGGLIIRALRDAGQLVRDAAKRMAPVLSSEKASSAFSARRYHAAGYALSKQENQRVPGNIKFNIVSYVTTEFAGRITSIIRVRTRSYIFSDRGNRKGMRGGADPSNRVDNPNYWWLVEFGTSHSRAQPFMRPAFQATKFAALEMIKTGLRDEIEKAAQRWARRAAR